jgi:hypothetical protein
MGNALPDGMTFLGRAFYAAAISLLLTLFLLVLFQAGEVPTENVEITSQAAPVSQGIVAEPQRN